MPPSSFRETRTVVSVDPHGEPLKQANPGEAFRIECLDFTGSFIQNSDCADDVLDFHWENDHHLSGPVRIEGAQPGDALRVDILDVQPFANRSWGFSLVDPGLGPLDQPGRTRVAKSIWDFDGNTASSRHVADIRFCGRPHCGVIGTAPSAELLQTWATREAALNEQPRNHGVICAQLPKAAGAYVGQPGLPPSVRTRIAAEGARTKPAREHGGNIDSSALTRGASIFLPVFVPGANLSVGDLHFNQGDGEPTCAIEMAGIATLRCTLLPGGAATLGLDKGGPIVLPSPAEPLYRQQVVFHGLSIDDGGVQHRSCLTTAFVQAASRAMDYLERFGYSHEQAYMIMAAAPIEAKVLAVPNIPTANVSVGLPTQIFDFDIQPTASGPVAAARGTPALLSKEREKAFLSGKSKEDVRSPFRDM